MNEVNVIVCRHRECCGDHPYALQIVGNVASDVAAGMMANAGTCTCSYGGTVGKYGTGVQSTMRMGGMPTTNMYGSGASKVNTGMGGMPTKNMYGSGASQMTTNMGMREKQGSMMGMYSDYGSGMSRGLPGDSGSTDMMYGSSAMGGGTSMSGSMQASGTYTDGFSRGVSNVGGRRRQGGYDVVRTTTGSRFRDIA